MRNVRSALYALAVWSVMLLLMPTVVDSPHTAQYSAPLPWSPLPTATEASLLAAVVVSLPIHITSYSDRWLTFKRGAVGKALLGTAMLAAMGQVTPGGMVVVLAASVASVAAPAIRDGWRPKILDAHSGMVVLGCLVGVPIAYWMLPFMPALVVALGVAAFVAAGNHLAARTVQPVKPPPGFDFRNTPLSQHPGDVMCDCPQHRNRRENPGTIKLCADCMGVFTRPVHAILSRRRRALLWCMRNVGRHFMALRLTTDVDECWFCGSARGGLRGKKAPPPDAS